MADSGYEAISAVARIYERAGMSCKDACEWEAAQIVRLSKLRHAKQAAELAASLRFIAEVRSLGTRLMAERRNVTPRAIRKARAKELAKIGTAMTNGGSA